jgi:hypothetical protein
MGDFAKAALGPVASIASGIIGSNAAGKAAKAQEQASEAAIAEQRRQFDYITQTARPSQLVGNEALSALADRLGLRRPVENQFVGDLAVTPGTSGTSQLANMAAGVPATPVAPQATAQQSQQASMTEAQNKLMALMGRLSVEQSRTGKSANPQAVRGLQTQIGQLQAQMGILPAAEGRLYDRNYQEGKVTLPGAQATAPQPILSSMVAPAPAPAPIAPAPIAPAPAPIAPIAPAPVAPAPVAAQQFQPIVIPPVAPQQFQPIVIPPAVPMQGAPMQLASMQAPQQGMTAAFQAAPSVALAAQNEAENPIGYYQAQQLLAPFYQAGVQGLGQLQQLAMGQGVPEFLATNPAYQFRQQEAQKALERSAASRGGLMSGQFAKALQERSQGLASQEFANAYDRLAGITQAGLGTAESLGGVTTERNKFVSNRADTKYGQLYNLANLGQSMTGQTQNAAQNMAMNVGNALTAAGQARAGGYINKANAMTGTIGDLASFGGRMFAGF